MVYQRSQLIRPSFRLSSASQLPFPPAGQYNLWSNIEKFLCVNQLNPELYSAIVAAGKMKIIHLPFAVQHTEVHSLIRQLIWGAQWASLISYLYSQISHTVVTHKLSQRDSTTNNRRTDLLWQEQRRDFGQWITIYLNLS